MAIHHLESVFFREKVAEALEDQTLRGALQNATGLFRQRRLAATASLSDWEKLRDQARAIKAETLTHLDHYLPEFVAKAESNGIKVHWARDHQEACQVISQLVSEKQARRIVKSKSMTTEEIGLNHVLETDGAEPIETDLGEWIIQLAGETPSHIIVPAIHKTKAQIADLFVDQLSIEPTQDAEELTKAARRILRHHFAQADMGISGVNFAIAETGSILILENEGNARMSTSLPKVHLAVMGLEKILPRLADLEVFLRLLPRSGTGQHLTSYQSILSGPKRNPDQEGPEELHLLILDNGRSAILAEEITRQSLACIRCGACLNACPVYQQIGGHAYGSVYPGPIGAIITPQLAGLSETKNLPYASSLCGACRDVCPVKIDIPEILLHLRAKSVEAHENGKEAKGFRMWAWINRSRFRFVWAHRLARLGGRIFMKNGQPPQWLQRRAPVLGAWAKHRQVPTLAKRSFREIWKKELSRKQP
ncbi:MAG: iron-sulfur cluster-binding protein [Planctomycetota bacterium]|nr:MAG: iron-sulfur cluster-binding protein [Planctomycetota bacterium]